jgi:hypothetical protein
MLLVKLHCLPGNFDGDTMLPFHRKCFFSGTHKNTLFQMVRKLLLQKSLFFIQNQHNGLGK